MPLSRVGLVAALTACSALGAIAFTAEPPASPAAPAHADHPANAERKSDPYTLDHCPVSGEKLGEMGDPVVKEIEGREVRFCCQGCVAEFEKDPKKYFKEIDKELIKQQLPYYPLATCVVEPDDELVHDGDDMGVNYIYKNRLVRFCCPGCIRKFNADPEPYLKTLDDAVVKAQAPKYPLDHCLVMEREELGEHPQEIVIANRLLRLCCKRCLRAVKQDSAKAIAKLDAAWKPIFEKEGKLPADASPDDPADSHTVGG